MARSINDPNERILPKSNQDYFLGRDRNHIHHLEVGWSNKMGYMSMVEREEIKKITGRRK